MKGIVITFLKTIDIGQTQDLFKDFVTHPKREPIIVTRKGRPIAVVQSVDGADVETISVSLSPQFQALMQKSRRRQDQEGGISSEEVRRRLGIPARRDKAPKGNGRTRKPKAG